jgi:acyl dehydratase
MAIPSSIVGTDIGESVVTVTPRMIMAYAAGLGASEECYLDDMRAGGIVAPPPFCVVLEWPLVSGRRYRQITCTSDSEGWGSIHVTQDSHFHQPVRPGRTLVTRGRIVQVRPTSAGAYVAAKFATHDKESGEAVATSWWASIALGVAVEGEARTLEDAPPLGAGVAGEGTLDWTPIAVARQLPHVYTECASIWNPIHTERAVALSKGLPDIILHGTATWALAAQEVVRRCAGGDPTRLRRLGGHFKGAVIPGTTITIGMRGDGADPCGVQLEVRNARGEPALTRARAEVSAAHPHAL